MISKISGKHFKSTDSAPLKLEISMFKNDQNYQDSRQLLELKVEEKIQALLSSTQNEDPRGGLTVVASLGPSFAAAAHGGHSEMMSD